MKKYIILVNEKQGYETPVVIKGLYIEDLQVKHYVDTDLKNAMIFNEQEINIAMKNVRADFKTQNIIKVSI